MNGRPILLALRRLWPFAALAACVYLGFLLFPGEAWWSAPYSTWSWMGVPILILGPLYGAWGAWWVRQCRRLTAGGAWRFSSRHRELATLLGPLIGPIVAMHLAGVVLALLLSSVRGTPLIWGHAILLGPQVAALLMCCFVGCAAASLVDHVLTAPLVGRALFLTPAVAYGRLPRELLVIGGGSLAPGYGPNPAYVAAQACSRAASHWCACSSRPRGHHHGEDGSASSRVGGSPRLPPCGWISVGSNRQPPPRHSRWRATRRSPGFVCCLSQRPPAMPRGRPWTG